MFRAVKRNEWRDRALARFIEEDVTADSLLSELKLLVVDRVKRTAGEENVALPYEAFKGEDGRIYLAEELLFRPLTALSPLRDGDQFFRAARDLSSGLAFLHRIGLVHRDLKLDNCGVDHWGVAKIFDLGSATSEGGKVLGSTLTRAPELFEENARCNKQSDVWALGAVLLALRTGDYPFVSAEELRSRPPINEKNEKRRLFDEGVKARALSPEAEAALRKKISETFPAGPREILEEMLAFEPAQRPSAESLKEKWEAAHRLWMPALTKTESRSPVSDALLEMRSFLHAVSEEQVGMSPRQWARALSQIDRLEAEAKDSPDESVLGEVRQLRDRISERRQGAEQNSSAATTLARSDDNLGT